MMDARRSGEEPKRRRTRVRNENRGGVTRGGGRKRQPRSWKRGGAGAAGARARARDSSEGTARDVRARSRRARVVSPASCVRVARSDPSLTHLDDERGARGGGLAGGDARHGGDDAKGGNGGGHRCWVCVRRERAVWSAEGSAPTRERHPKTSAGQSRKIIHISHASRERGVPATRMWLSNVAERENAPTEYPYEKKSQSEFSQNMTTVTVRCFLRRRSERTNARASPREREKKPCLLMYTRDANTFAVRSFPPLLSG